MKSGVALAALAAAVAVAAPARAGTALVVTGHGWGHGVGMSQWGAYGYAKHGWGYRRILRHYYPGTKLGRSGEPRVRVLLVEHAKLVTVGCKTPFKVGKGRSFSRLPAGRYGVGPRLVLPVRADGRGRSLGRLAVFACAKDPLTLDGRAYHGAFVVRSDGTGVSVVNVLPLDTYLRGVVPSESPSRWPLAALEAQAVAARSYAVSELRPDARYDLLPDTRDQVYGGVAAERRHSDKAVYQTRRVVLTWDGEVARTYYSSSSGGRTEAVQDAWPGASPVPYLRSVPDPYDTYSPHHTWGPLAFSPSRLAARLGLGGAVASVRLQRDSSWRVASARFRLDSGAVVTRSGEQVERALALRSTWFSIGELRLWTSRTRVSYGGRVTVVAHTAGARGAVLQQQNGHGWWRTVRHVRHGSAQVQVQPRASTSFRVLLRGPGEKSATSVDVAVAPRLQVRLLGPKLIAGTVAPRTSAPVTVWRSVGGDWRLVSRSRLSASGDFHTPIRLQPGRYKVAVASDGALTSTQTRLRVTRRMLARLRR